MAFKSLEFELNGRVGERTVLRPGGGARHERLGDTLLKKMCGADTATPYGMDRGYSPRPEQLQK